MFFYVIPLKHCTENVNGGVLKVLMYESRRLKQGKGKILISDSKYMERKP